MVFDKFAPEGGQLSVLRRILNIFSSLFGTEITRRFGEMLQDSGAQVIKQEASLLGGNYQIFLLKRKNLRGQ